MRPEDLPKYLVVDLQPLKQIFREWGERGGGQENKPTKPASCHIAQAFG